MKTDPIIAVRNVPECAAWYQAVFNCHGRHGGDEFEILCDESGEVLLCLHKWGAHEHPTMRYPDPSPGNGMILYFRAANLDAIRQNLAKMNHPVEAEIAVNPNSGQREFSLRDPEGYFLMVSEYHEYGG